MKKTNKEMLDQRRNNITFREKEENYYVIKNVDLVLVAMLIAIVLLTLFNIPVQS